MKKAVSVSLLSPAPGLSLAVVAGESLLALLLVTPAPLSDAVSWMAHVGGQWDERLAALESSFGARGLTS